MSDGNQRWGTEQTNMLNQLVSKRKVVPGSTTASQLLKSNDPEVLAANSVFKKLKSPRDSLHNQLKKLENTTRIEKMMPVKIGLKIFFYCFDIMRIKNFR